MTEYLLKISGVHYGANGDFVAGQKDTEETHMRTLKLLRWLDSERPIVVLAPDTSNHIHSDAIMARARGRRIGRVAMECVEMAWALLRQSGQPMIMARVNKVAIKENAKMSLESVFIRALFYEGSGWKSPLSLCMSIKTQ